MGLAVRRARSRPLCGRLQLAALLAALLAPVNPSMACAQRSPVPTPPVRASARQSRSRGIAQARPSADSIAKLRIASAFAFRARVDSLHASTLAEVPASAHTIAVTPHVALQCPYAVGMYDNAPLTVYVKDTIGLARGQEYWFFAAGWIVGSRLAVRELVRIPGRYGDSALTRQFLGPNGPSARIREHLRDTVYVVTGTLLLDSLRASTHAVGPPPTHVVRQLRITSTLTTPYGWPIASIVPVMVPTDGLVHWSLLQVPDAHQHLLFFVHPTTGLPADMVSSNPMPPYMLRDVNDVWPRIDSAYVAGEIKKQQNTYLGTPSRDFVRRCRSKAK